MKKEKWRGMESNSKIGFMGLPFELITVLMGNDD
jgi:hypothetical protein